jgi:hypothetical protein
MTFRPDVGRAPDHALGHTFSLQRDLGIGPKPFTGAQVLPAGVGVPEPFLGAVVLGLPALCTPQPIEVLTERARARMIGPDANVAVEASGQLSPIV